MYREQGRPTALLVETSAAAPKTTTHTHDSGAHPAFAAPVLSVALVGSDPVGSSTLRHMLLQTGLVKELQEWASVKTVELRHPKDVPDVVLLDLSGNAESDFAFAQQLSRLRPSTHIIACTARKESSPEFLLSAMRSGVRDFLQKPYDRAELFSLIARIGSDHLPKTSARTATGKLFVVLGTKGGVGTSTVAVNLAVQLARIPGKTTVLFDFSRPLGDVAALLDLTPSFQVRDALENFKRLDATMLGGLLTPHKSGGLRVLCGAARLEDWQNASFPAIERIVEVAQQSFDYTVMDLGSFYSAEWQNVLQAAEVLLVSEADLPGLAKLNRHLGSLSKLNVSSTSVRLVINRWHRHDEPALEKVETGMRIPVFARLPNEFKQVNEATVRGDSLKKASDPLTAEFHKMAARLAGAGSANQPKKSRLGHLFSF
jgi:pilus assembly protein CpaE